MKCPKCEKKLNKKNYCTYCKLSICPHCNHFQEYRSPLKWQKTVIGTILFPFLLIFMVITDTFALVNFFFNEKCKNCNKRF